VQYWYHVVKLKITSVPLFRKREFILALMDGKQSKSTTFNFENRNKTFLSSLPNVINIAKNTLKHSFVSVNLARDDFKETAASASRTKSYQDFVSWFIDDGFGGTLLVVVMKVDLGDDIPRYIKPHHHHHLSLTDNITKVDISAFCISNGNSVNQEMDEARRFLKGNFYFCWQGNFFKSFLFICD
jgi:hypothetical protein